MYKEKIRDSQKHLTEQTMTTHQTFRLVKGVRPQKSNQIRSLSTHFDLTLTKTYRPRSLNIL